MGHYNTCRCYSQNRRANSFDTDTSLKLYEIPFNETKHYNSENNLANNSDNEKHVTSDIEYSTSKYERLHDEIETIIVHRENSESSIKEICNEKELFQSNNKHTKIKISLSQEQICNLVTGSTSTKTNIKNTSAKNTIIGLPQSALNINLTLPKDSDPKNKSNINLLKSDKDENAKSADDDKSSSGKYLKPPTTDDRRYSSQQSSINLALPIVYDVQRKVSAPDVNSKKINDQLIKSKLFPHRSTPELENTHKNR